MTAKEKSPAFQFYPKDWISSAKVQCMTMAQRGGYWQLLCYMWLEETCSLPDDDAILANLSGLGEGWCNGGSDMIRKCFVVKNGKLTNLRLEKELDKQKNWSSKSSEGGKASAKARKQKKIEAAKGGRGMVTTKQTPKGNIAVCSLQFASSLPLPKGKGAHRGPDFTIQNCSDIRNKEDIHALTSRELRNVCASLESDGATVKNLRIWAAQVARLEVHDLDYVLRQAIGKLFDDSRDGLKPPRNVGQWLQSIVNKTLKGKD